jgi:hypothetical protein
MSIDRITIDEIKRVELSKNGEWSEFELTPEEIEYFKQLAIKKADDPHLTAGLNWGTVVNNSDSKTAVYGPRSPRDKTICGTTPCDNTLYVLAPHKTTPNNWDADGVFIPNDVAVEVSGKRHQGPVAVKIPDTQTLTLSGTRSLRKAEGFWMTVFKPNEVHWKIANVPQKVIDDFRG